LKLLTKHTYSWGVRRRHILLCMNDGRRGLRRRGFWGCRFFLLWLFLFGLDICLGRGWGKTGGL